MKTFWPDKLSYFTERTLIGAGQYGLVYRVFNPQLNNVYVIKLIESAQDARKDARKRFLQEMRSLNKINSEHVVKLINSWIEPDFVAFEMEYVPGLSLDRLNKRLVKFDYSEKEPAIVEIISQITEGLEAIHAQDLVHRDIKPANILIKMDNYDAGEKDEKTLSRLLERHFQVKITDLGVVKDLTASVSITRTSDFLGTAAYISPEQALGRKITPASDLYSLGVVWYEMVTGKNPFQSRNIYQTISAHIHQKPPQASAIVTEFPAVYSQILMLLLQKDPAQRFYSAANLKTSLLSEATEVDAVDRHLHSLIDYRASENHFRECSLKFLRDLQTHPNNARVFLIDHTEAKESSYFLQLTSYFVDSNKEYLLYYTPSFNRGIHFSLVGQAMKLFTQEEKSLFRSSLSSGSIAAEILEMMELDDFNQQNKLAHNKLNNIPYALKLYNWIQLLAEQIKFLNQRKPVLVFLDRFDIILEQFRFIIPTLMFQLSETSVRWILGNTKTPSRDDLPIPYEDQESIDWISYFTSREYEAFKSEARHNFFSVPEPSPPLDSISDGYPSIEQESLNEEEKYFMALLSVSGAHNPLHYATWLLKKEFHGNIRILSSLFQKGILGTSIVNPAADLVYFKNPEFHHRFLKTLSKELYNKSLSISIEFWRTQNSLEAREKLFDLLAQKQTFSEALPLALELLGFLYGTAESGYMTGRSEKYFDLQSSYKIPGVFSSNLKFYRALRLVIDQDYDKALDSFLALYENLSEKYLSEKFHFSLFIVMLSIITDNNSAIQKTITDIKQYQDAPPLLTQHSRFLEAIYLFRQGDAATALAQIGEALLHLNNSGFSWHTAFGCLVISYILFQNKDWEKSYQYSAMAFQAGRSLNDYWTIDRTLRLVEKNPYYLKNKSSVLDWSTFRSQIMRFPVGYFDDQDFRDLLVPIKY